MRLIVTIGIAWVLSLTLAIVALSGIHWVLSRSEPPTGTSSVRLPSSRGSGRRTSGGPFRPHDRAHHVVGPDSKE
jgi:hypothetical protein